MAESERTALTDVQRERVVDATRNWLERAVIGLNLCPFAKAAHVQRRIRYAVSTATSADALLVDLEHELRYLASSDPSAVETTLLIHPHALADFLAFNDFLDRADAVLDALDLTGSIQIASFHPAYQFAGAQPDDIENYTNRSPYPILHLLREDSIEQGLQAFPDAARIFERNIEALEQLGHDGWSKLGIGPAAED